MKTNTIEILAGNSVQEIERAILSEVSNNFCVDEEEFKNEYPGDKPVRYRVQVTVTPIK
ncbi:hypothetical protein [Duganella vulcania]|uniref:Uncharacterized protein n=1 Tax=Duganella vulcania TaxID=2692166 RepID=A0A845GI14_9BURK|nr:hypothetical protein [Duganella vulcania]MYM92407.1 hypothetical protein [Duganella vulcania]